jgi:hypothetical protein
MAHDQRSRTVFATNLFPPKIHDRHQNSIVPPFESLLIERTKFLKFPEPKINAEVFDRKHLYINVLDQTTAFSGSTDFGLTESDSV